MADIVTSKRCFKWPNNAKIAVVVTCLLENWSEDKGLPFSVQTTALKPGTHDRAAMTWGRYGGRNGVWRLLKILNENKAPSTFSANAKSMELAPRAVDAILRSGHEIAAHSYTQDALMVYLSPEDERAMIRKCNDVFVKMTGAKAKGWISPVLAPTANTEAIVAEEGFLWYGTITTLTCRSAFIPRASKANVSCARGVGNMPVRVRTRSGSASCWRSRLSAALIAVATDRDCRPRA